MESQGIEEVRESMRILLVIREK